MKEIGAWKQIRRKVMYKNPWIEVIEDDVVRPDGTDGIYGFMRGPGGSSTLPIDEEGNVYLIKMFRYIVEKDLYDIPGGLLEEGEDPLDAAKRELREETGITANEWISLGTSRPLAGLADFREYMYLAKGLTFGEQDLDATEKGENIRIVKMPLTEAVEKVMRGEFLSELVCLVLLKAHYYLTNNQQP